MGGLECQRKDGEKRTCLSWFSLSTMCVPRIKPRSDIRCGNKHLKLGHHRTGLVCWLVWFFVLFLFKQITAKLLGLDTVTHPFSLSIWQAEEDSSLCVA